jgi:CheY-like chemotaxis protein
VSVPPDAREQRSDIAGSPADASLATSATEPGRPRPHRTTARMQWNSRAVAVGPTDHAAATVIPMPVRGAPHADRSGERGTALRDPPLIREPPAGAPGPPTVRAPTAAAAARGTTPAIPRSPRATRPHASSISVLIADAGDGLGAVLADRIGNHEFDARVASSAEGTLAEFTRMAYDVVLVPAFAAETTAARLVGQLRALPGGGTAIIAPYTQVPSSSLYASYLAAGADQVITLPATTAHLRLIITAAVRRLRQLTELGAAEPRR